MSKRHHLRRPISRSFKCGPNTPLSLKAFAVAVNDLADMNAAITGPPCELSHRQILVNQQLLDFFCVHA